MTPTHDGYDGWKRASRHVAITFSKVSPIFVEKYDRWKTFLRREDVRWSIFARQISERD